MINRYHIALNFIGFQIGWFACVLMAAQGQPEIGIAIALIIVAFHLFVIQARLNTLALLFSVTLLGSAWDSVLTSQQILVFSSGLISPYLAPSWIIMMWLLFATTLNVSLRWLYGRTWLAMLLGAVAGPLAYQAGAALGAVVIPDPLVGNIVLAIGWAGLLPLFINTAEAFDAMAKTRMMPK